MALRLILITFAILFATSFTFAEDLTINCLYVPDKQVYVSKTDKFLTCNLKSNLTATATVTEAIGEPGTTLPTDVKIFEVTEVLIQRIPKGLKTVFANLIGIKIHNTEFNYLSKDDLTEYALLQFLEISNSKLSVILGDTFSENTKLELIDFSGNSIFYIGAAAFDDLTVLTYLNFNQTLCLLDEDGVADTDAKITALKALLPDKCGASQVDMALTAVMKNYLDAIEASQNCGIDNPEEECPDECETQLAECQEKYNNQTKLLETCNSDIKKLDDENKELQNTIDDLESQSCESGNGTCNFKLVSNVYSCIAGKLSIKTAAEQTVNWTGTHATGKNNDAVLSMTINSQTIEILPLNIGTVFKNLKTLIIRNSGLTKIKAGDFKTLTKLETLEITGNNIASIDATAFSGLTALTKIDLSANKLTELPSKVFDALLKLSIINLSDNDMKIRYDVINANNTIAEAYLMNNNAIVPFDKTFIWRLQKAQKIDLSGTGCDYSLDKTQPNPPTFMVFYYNIISNC
ncbi:hypothetical protein ACKWTF_014584 [Chironomus riparius]